MSVEAIGGTNISLQETHLAHLVQAPLDETDLHDRLRLMEFTPDALNRTRDFVSQYIAKELPNVNGPLRGFINWLIFDQRAEDTDEQPTSPPPPPAASTDCSTSAHSEHQNTVTGVPISVALPEFCFPEHQPVESTQSDVPMAPTDNSEVSSRILIRPAKGVI